MNTTCPFCNATEAESTCWHCRRDTNSPRRICGGCGQMSPTREDRCCHCHARFSSELWTKVPIIVAMFLASAVLTVAFHVLSQ